MASDGSLGPVAGGDPAATTPRHVFVASTTSTLDLAHHLAEDGAPNGTLVVADEQTAGRGRQGRAWHSPVGGLWLACVVRPTAAPEASVLSLRVGLAVTETLASFLRDGRRLQIKWPNDVLLDGRKVGGVLCEARWRGGRPQWVAVGVGINLTNPIPPELKAEATSAGDVPRDRLALALGAALERLAGGGVQLSPQELERLDRVDALRDRRLASPLAGTARGVAPDGALLVETARGVEAAHRGSPRLA